MIALTLSSKIIQKFNRMTDFKKMELQLGGRPKKSKKIRVNTYLTGNEEQELRELSKTRDLSISHLIRESIIHHLLLRDQTI